MTLITDHRNAADEPAVAGNVPLSPWPVTAAGQAAAIIRLKGMIFGRAEYSDESTESLGRAAAVMVDNYAPDAPQAVKDEAVIRFAGYLANSDFGGFRKEPSSVGGADGGEYVVNHAPAFRNCGAAMLLTRWRRRRARAI